MSTDTNAFAAPAGILVEAEDFDSYGGWGMR
jgi:hypothetical protein